MTKAELERRVEALEQRVWALQAALLTPRYIPVPYPAPTYPQPPLYPWYTTVGPHVICCGDSTATLPVS